MSRGASVWRWTKRIAGAVVLVAVLVSAGIIGTAEWNHFHPGAVKAWEPAPDGVDTAAGSFDPRPVLILLHGAGLNGHMWDPVVRGIDPAYRVIAPDLPGHGARTDERYTLASAAATVAAIARAVAPAPVIVGGDSLGGYSAMAAADAVPPGQLRGLVVSGASSNFGGRMRLKWMRDTVMYTSLFAFADEEALAGKAVGHFFDDPADRRAVLAAGIRLGAVSEASRALMGVDFLDTLGRTGVPVLIVNGDQDARAMSEEALFVAAAKHGSRHVFADTPHGVSMLEPAGFAQLLNDFAAANFAGTGAPR